MKKIIVALILCMFLIGLVGAEQGKKLEKKIEIKEEKIKILKEKIKSDLELNEEKIGNITRLKAKLSNGRNAEIKIMPETASEKAFERLKLKVCNETNNCTIVLKEVGKGNQTKIAYDINLTRSGKFLGIFKTKTKIITRVDAENGEIINVNKPWWAVFVKYEKE